MNNVLFGNIRNPNLWVYHYTSVETALEKIFPSGKLRMGVFSAVNDPRESKDWTFSLSASSDKNVANDEFFAIQQQASTYIKAHCKLLCMSRDDPRSADDGPDYAFHRGYARSRMWAQYGGNHSGVCLIFDRHKLNNCIAQELGSKGKIYSGNVKYLNFDMNYVNAFQVDYDEIASTSLTAALNQKIEQYYKTYFFTKAEDWASEIEWRWVLRGNDVNPEYVSFASSILAIVLGVDFPQKQLPDIEYFALKFNIHLARIVWNNGQPGVLPCPSVVSS